MSYSPHHSGIYNHSIQCNNRSAPALCLLVLGSTTNNRNNPETTIGLYEKVLKVNNLASKALLFDKCSDTFARN